MTMHYYFLFIFILFGIVLVSNTCGFITQQTLFCFFYRESFWWLFTVVFTLSIYLIEIFPCVLQHLELENKVDEMKSILEAVECLQCKVEW